MIGSPVQHAKFVNSLLLLMFSGLDFLRCRFNGQTPASICFKLFSYFYFIFINRSIFIFFLNCLFMALCFLKDRDTVSVRCDNNGMHAKLEKRGRGVFGKSRSNDDGGVSVKLLPVLLD